MLDSLRTFKAFPCHTERYTGCRAEASLVKPEAQSEEPTCRHKSVAALPASLKASQLQDLQLSEAG